MNNCEYRVSDEWAKQLTFIIRPDLDFEIFSDVKVIIAPEGIRLMVLPIPFDNVISWRDDTEKIHLEKFADPLNSEVTYLGYAPKNNAIILGITYHVKKVKGNG